jgi:predicted dehydrogenase
VGVIGVGYWGPNLIRNFHQVSGAECRWAVDLDADRLAHVQSMYPALKTSRDVGEMIDDPEVDAVVIATPVDAHCELACRALEAGKHVFVEKPMARTAGECRKMLEVADRRGGTLMVGHTFLYNSVVRRVRQLIQEGELGEIFYVHMTRVNLGLFREDVNVVWDLAPHDVAILGYILGSGPVRVNATGSDYVQPGIEDVAFIDLEFRNKVRANLHVSWLDPNKIRRVTVVGSKKMLVYDDTSNTEKLRVYDKGVTVLPHYDSYGEFQLSYRYGDIAIPRIEETEPLKTEAQHFIDCIREGHTPLSDGRNGLEVVEVLEGACLSIKQGGSPVELNGVGAHTDR